jgi:hypothetical protein
MRKGLLLFTCFALIALHSSAQVFGWQYKKALDIVDTSGIAHTNYAVQQIFDSQTLISNGSLQPNGGDLRFGNLCGDSLYPYWIESGLNTAQTVVWILLPAVPANATTTIWMYYGNATAPDGNDFAGTFPAAIRTGGSNLTLTGTLTPDFVWVEATDTIFLTAGAVLTLNNVRKLRVDATGQINGSGRGFQGPPINTIGTGPGGGGTSTNSGCGGGSYGGVGGTGGLDAGDTPGTGGATYGTAAGTDCEMGSSGGSGTGISTGGNGGGGLDVTAEFVQINGAIVMNGNTALIDGTGRGGGGGAGGCIKITCASATGSGNLTAAGGNGGFGTSTNNDSGGGGGGGRIKSFSQAAWPGTLIQSTAGGIGGPNGGAGPGQPGGIGSVSNVVQAFAAGVNPTIVAGSEVDRPQITNASTNICNGDSLPLTATAAMASYLWSNGDTDFTTTVGAVGTYSVILFDSAGCEYRDSVDVASYVSTPILITASGTGTVCAGECDTLTASAGFLAYAWSIGATTQSIVVCSSGDFVVEGNDSNGCAAIDTFTFTVLPPINLNAGSAAICDGSTALLDASGPFVAWLWSTNETTPTITVSATGNYSVTVTDTNGCEGADTFVVTVLPLPVPTIVASGADLSVTPSYPAYQWLLNGSPISGATGATYTATTTGTYSVTVTDLNGCIGTSDTTFVLVGIAQPAAMGASISPNPTAGTSTIAWVMDGPRALRISVTDALGRVVMATELQGQAGANRLDLQLAAFPAGMYQVHLSDGELHQVLRLIKQ